MESGKAEQRKKVSRNIKPCLYLSIHYTTHTHTHMLSHTHTHTHIHTHTHTHTHTLIHTLFLSVQSKALSKQLSTSFNMSHRSMHLEVVRPLVRILAEESRSLRAKFTTFRHSSVKGLNGFTTSFQQVHIGDILILKITFCISIWFILKYLTSIAIISLTNFTFDLTSRLVWVEKILGNSLTNLLSPFPPPISALCSPKDVTFLRLMT